jgi:CubicO group peptidase (beta-lactamase class C family)
MQREHQRGGTSAFVAYLSSGVILGTLVGAPVVSAEMDRTRLRQLNEVVETAIAEGAVPGAVLVVGHAGEIVYERAFGTRSIGTGVAGTAEEMTLDTVFDLASLTKVIATTTSVMQLVEHGRLRLGDRVATYLPGFDNYGKGPITLVHLLTHTSGLAPDLPLEDVFEGSKTALARTFVQVPVAGVGERFIYSDLNFMLLAHIVERVSGQSFDRFVQDHLFDPLGMVETWFNPPAALRDRIAPTERCAALAWPCGDPEAPMLRGRVHDPTARRMGGVAGHAGLFSTAKDLASFCAMLLAGGAYEGGQLLAPLTVARMTTVSTPSHLADKRGLGWDIDSRFSSNRGDLFSVGSYGHTGFTGTSLWLDPVSETFVVFLSSRLHPEGEGDVRALRGEVATLVASALRD